MMEVLTLTIACHEEPPAAGRAGFGPGQRGVPRRYGRARRSAAGAG